MKKILAFAGSNSSTSINRQLLKNVTGRLENREITHLNLTDYPLPIYSADLEKEGFPENVEKLRAILDDYEAMIIAVNEHNRTVSAFFKNFLDWMSRSKRNFMEGKEILLISTSPGRMGAKESLEYSKYILGRFGGNVIESFSFPSFKDNFENGQVINEVLDMGIQDVVTTFAHQIDV